MAETVGYNMIYMTRAHGCDRKGRHSLTGASAGCLASFHRLTGLEPRDVWTTEVCNARPVQCQPCGYLPSRNESTPVDRYRIILLYDYSTQW